MIRPALLIAAVAIPVHASEFESDYRNRLCGGEGWQMEKKIDGGTQPDCQTPRLAIEVDWSRKWAESLGQALQYAVVTKKHSAIIILCERRKTAARTERRCSNHVQFLEQSARLVSVPVIVWQCGPDVRVLSECKRHEFGGVR